MAYASIVKFGTTHYLIHPSLSSNIPCKSIKAAKEMAEHLGFKIYTPAKAKHAPKCGPTRLYGFKIFEDNFLNKSFEYKS